MNNNDRIDFNPGKYTSETGKFYFSCDTGESVLVGVKQRITSIGAKMETKEITTTCPILGLQLLFPDPRSMNTREMLEREYDTNPDQNARGKNGDTPEGELKLKLKPVVPARPTRVYYVLCNNLAITILCDDTPEAKMTGKSRPTTPYFNDGSGIAFVTKREWLQVLLATKEELDNPENKREVYPREYGILLKLIDDAHPCDTDTDTDTDTDDDEQDENENMCLLFSEAGLYTLHTCME